MKLWEKDGTTPRNVTGLTLTLRMKSINDPTILKSLPCTLTNPVVGEFYVVTTTDVTGTIDEYEAQIETSQASVLLDPSEKFTIIVSPSSAVAGP